MDSTPYWQASSALPQFPSLTNDLEVDVVVIGAGLTGITTAWLMKEAGAHVALLDRQRCACADTAHTTAHLTYVTDERLHHLVKVFGRDAARAFWEAGQEALDQMDALVRKLRIDCEFKWVPGYLHASPYAENNEERALLEEDAALASEFGFDAHFAQQVPYANRPGVQFGNQAKFHPLKYLAPLLQNIHGDRSYVFENSEASQVDTDPLTVHVGRYKIRCDYLVIATHNPLVGKNSLVKATLFQSKLALYTSYVLGAKVRSGSLPEALFWDTADPYSYMRVDHRGDHDYIIFGGEDVKTGQEDDSANVFARLRGRMEQVLPGAQVKHQWLGQVVETNDGLPFIGESAGQQFIATGFCGNGFTLGTLSAVMARDRYLARKNPWFELFRIDRRKFHGGAWRYITENLDYPYYLVRDRLRGAEAGSVDTLKIGEGKVLKLDGNKVAAFRDETGKVVLCSPVCTHLNCIVHWNAADKTWDCPCHGSRFKPTGEVLAGPAEEALQKMPWPQEAITSNR